MSTPDRVRLLIEPLVSDLGLNLYDLELNGGSLRVLVDVPGGVDMGAITKLTRAISRSLDEHDPISGHFTLEVSSPGLERPLRTPDHFTRAIGTKVTIKTVAGLEGARRVVGLLTEADDESFVVTVDDPAGQSRRLAYGDIERARTVFEWGPATKPGKAAKKSSAKTPKGNRPETVPTPSPNEKVSTS
ncbi:MAG: ribosome maturation factor RimP [Actinomycetes bacterium]